MQHFNWKSTGIHLNQFITLIEIYWRQFFFTLHYNWCKHLQRLSLYHYSSTERKFMRMDGITTQKLKHTCDVFTNSKDDRKSSWSTSYYHNFWTSKRFFSINFSIWNFAHSVALFSAIFCFGISVKQLITMYLMKITCSIWITYHYTNLIYQKFAGNG